MRIISGKFKNAFLRPPLSFETRPTAERIREAIFNILMHRYPSFLDGARVLDLFAGTGAMALEALSRGASFGAFIDHDPQVRQLLRENIVRLGLEHCTTIHLRDATKLGKSPELPFSLAFLDPPYHKDLIEKTLLTLQMGKWLHPRSLCFIETEKKETIRLPEGYYLLEKRIYGNTQILVVSTSDSVALAF